MHINEIISPVRVEHALVATSKKRLLEQLSKLLHKDTPGLDEQAVFQCLTEREKLGSTGIGHGVALPHGRLKGLEKAIGAFAILEQEMDFDAIDQKPVKMIFALLVPEEAHDEHLKMLSKLASIFNNEALRERLLQARDDNEIYQCLTSQDGDD
ncbi:MAG: PTS IIA-like nitrogen regulatory protein PtsN [Gammaproteobacteria bacterium]|nr:PTS IIA-like nitrogen regulatory protein PtsN [Gammaproteobacteria bacterium]